MLFQLKKFISAAGFKLDWRVEGDALSDEDWECIAYVGAKIVGPFCKVVGVPRGGIKLARAMEKYVDMRDDRWLFTDDVFTTGKSMHETIAYYGDRSGRPIGFVAFARGPLPAHVKCMWKLGGVR